MESFLRKSATLEPGEDLNFQILTWESMDIESDENIKEYCIYLFGVDRDSRSVGLHVQSFRPFYYIRVPDSLQQSWTDYHTNVVKDVMKRRYRDAFKSILLCEKVNVKGFTNNSKQKFVRLTFTTIDAYNKSRYYFYPTVWTPTVGQQKGDLDVRRLPSLPSLSREPLLFDIFEHNLEPFIRFSHIQNIEMAGWVNVKAAKLRPSDNTRCQLNYECRWDYVKPDDTMTVSNFTCGSFDIECTSYSKKGFPDYKKDNDAITQIGTTLVKYATGEKWKHIVTRASPIDGGCDPVDGVTVVVAKDEMAIVEEWVAMLVSVDVDFLVGYNTYDFDWRYIYQRCVKAGAVGLLSTLSRMVSMPAYYRKERLSSSAYGDNYFEFVHPYGVTNLDLRVLVKRDHKLDSYKLNNVAKHFTGDVKDDLSPYELFVKVEGSNEDMAVVCKYCVQDTNLVVDLFMKLCLFSNMIGMANKARVPISYVELKGQQVKVFSQLLYEARLLGFIVPTMPYNTTNDDSFTGATVLNAVPGAYYRPIAGLDFASLYPSIMISKNYCYSTIVDDEAYGSIEGIEYEVISWTDADGRKYDVKFVQNVKGLLPTMLDKLWKERKRIKKLMKSADEDMYKVYDGQQLAIKVSMNSIYGFTGATFGRLPDKRIASAVTAEGRKSIEKSKEFAESNYDCEVIYGDTDSIYVMYNTPYSGKAHFDECFRLAEECADRITEALFRKPMELEFEKIMYPFYLFTKKRYATVIWTNPTKYDYIDYKGIQIKRRDSCAYVKEEGVRIFETLLLNDIYSFEFGLDNRNITLATQMAKDAIGALLRGQVPLDKLIVSKSFREGYAYEHKAVCPECGKTWYAMVNGKKDHRIPDTLLKNVSRCPSCDGEVMMQRMLPNLPHVALALKMHDRDPFNCPIVGDRVPYVFIKGADNLKQYEKVEDPLYATNNMLEIDYLYYFDHQLKSVLETIFEVVVPSMDTIFEEANAYKPPKRIRRKAI
jgi:DNA polymerase delta subunit 1